MPRRLQAWRQRFSTVILMIAVGLCVHVYHVVTIPRTRGVTDTNSGVGTRIYSILQPPQTEEPTPVCRGLWRGDLGGSMSGKPSPHVSLVISHCEADLDWLPDFILNTVIRNITIFSKVLIYQPHPKYPPCTAAVAESS